MVGISVYSRKDRPCWYVAYDCPRRLKRVNESTGIKLEDAKGKVRAYAFARERAAPPGTLTLTRKNEAWGNWVEKWLKDRYRNSSKTLTSYLGAWKHLAFFFHERDIIAPAQVEYHHVVDFVHWRESQKKKTSKKKVSRNTALHNAVVLSRVMSEAIRRGYAKHNPCAHIKQEIPPDPAPEKPDIKPEHIPLIRQILRDHARNDWMATAFEIALHQGCRISACQIPMQQIDFKRGTIQLVEKGSKGKPKVFTMPMHPNIRPLLERLRDEGRTVTCDIPKIHGSQQFSRLMKRHGLPYTFHSTRVTVISQFARDGVSQQQAMAYVHHGSWAINKTYQRLRPEDLQDCIDVLNFGPAEIPPSSALNQPKRK